MCTYISPFIVWNLLIPSLAERREECSETHSTHLGKIFQKVTYQSWNHFAAFALVISVNEMPNYHLDYFSLWSQCSLKSPEFSRSLKPPEAGSPSTQCPNSALLFFQYPEGAKIVFPESKMGFSSPPESQAHFAGQPDSKRSLYTSFFLQEKVSVLCLLLFPPFPHCCPSELRSLCVHTAPQDIVSFYSNHISKGCYVLEIYSLNYWGGEPRKYLCLFSKLCLLHLANCFTSHLILSSWLSQNTTYSPLKTLFPSSLQGIFQNSLL